MANRSTNRRWLLRTLGWALGCRWLVLGGCLLALNLPGATLTNVTAANVTPSGFSVVWTGSSGLRPALAVYSDAKGSNSLNGTVGVETNAVHSGNPALISAYSRALSVDRVVQQMSALGAGYVSVTGCQPGTTYHYRALLYDALGQEQARFPSNGLLPAVTTPLENSFVLQAQQLLLTLPRGNPAGSIVTLSNTNTSSVLAAVVGDGAGTNQVFFNLSDLLSAQGSTNFLPLGVQDFTAKVLGASTNGLKQTYTLASSTSFEVGSGSQFNLGSYVAVALAGGPVRAGDAGSIPITLIASTTVTNLSFLMNIPSNRFSNLSIQGTIPQLAAPGIQFVGPDLVRITLPAVHGQNLLGNQSVAQINFTTISNQASAFVPLQPQSVQGANADGSPAANIFVQAGQLVIIGNQSLLSAELDPDGNRNLTLYGKIGSSYEIQSSPNLADAAAWTDLLQLPMTNLVQVISGLDTNGTFVAYRAIEFFADPPIAHLNSIQDGQSAIGTGGALLYGRAGREYEIQYSEASSAAVTWYPLLRCTLTNSFQFVTHPGLTNPTFRLRIRSVEDSVE